MCIVTFIFLFPDFNVEYSVRIPEQKIHCGVWIYIFCNQVEFGGGGGIQVIQALWIFYFK